MPGLHQNQVDFRRQATEGISRRSSAEIPQKNVSVMDGTSRHYSEQLEAAVTISSQSLLRPCHSNDGRLPFKKLGSRATAVSGSNLTVSTAEQRNKQCREDVASEEELVEF